MLDKFMEKGAIRRDVRTDASYRPDHAVLGYWDSGPKDASKKLVIFPPWHTHIDSFPFRVLSYRAARAGFSVRRYDFNDHILEPNVDRVLESFNHIQQTVTSDLKKSAKERKNVKFHAWADSIGAVAAFVTVGNSDLFSSTTLVVGSPDLAASTWDGTRTVEIRRDLEKQGVSRSGLVQKWSEIALQANLGSFEGMPVNIIGSDQDTFVPTDHQRELPAIFKKAGANVQSEFLSTGHLATIGKTCYFPDFEIAA